MLLRGGLRAADEADVAGVVDREAAGDGVDVSDMSWIASSLCMSATTNRRKSTVLPCRSEESMQL